MSRLYSWTRSDTRKAAVTSGGHEEIESQINWGSRDRSMLAGRIAVSWDRDKERPTLYIETGDVKVVMDGREIK